MAATDLERLVVSLEAKITSYERAMQKATNHTDRTARRIESRFERMNRNVGKGFLSLQKNIATAFAAVAVTRGATQLIDSSTRIENALKVAGLAGEELNRVYSQLYDSARRNAAPLESLVQLYGRAALVQDQLGVSTDQLLSFTDNIALALRVSGQSASEASGALLQLSQALGSGVVRAEEFNSILEGAPTILQAAAAGIAEAGGDVSKLRALMLEGRLSSRALFDGFEIGAQILEEKVAGSTLTVSQAMENLRTELINVARNMDEGTDISVALATGLGDVAQVIRDVGEFANWVVTPINSMGTALNNLLGSVREFIEAGAAVNGLDQIGAGAATAINNLGVPGLTAGSSRAGNVVSGTFELLGATPQDEALASLLTGQQREVPQITVHANPISLDDPIYAPPPSTGGGSGGGGRSGSGARGGGDRFNEALESLRQRNEQLRLETSLYSTLNPLVDDYGYAQERAKVQAELLNAATEAGIALSPDQIEAINQLSESYAQATAESARLAEQQDAVREAFEDFKGIAKSVFSGFISDLRSGKSAAEALGNAFGRLADQLIDMALNAAINSLFSSLSGMFFGAPAAPVSLGVPGFARGTANTGGARGQVRGVVHGQEAVIPLPNGGRVPVQIKGGGETSMRSVSFGDIHVSVPQSEMGEGADQAQAIARAVKNAVRMEIADNMRPGGLLNPRL